MRSATDAPGTATLQRVTGLEAWFTPKGVTAATASSPQQRPPPHTAWRSCSSASSTS
jgi:hypothetical protein